MKRIYIGLLAIILTSCAAETDKKVLVLGRGTLNIRENKIEMNDGAGSAEQEIIMEKGWKELIVKTPTIDRKFEIPEESGCYILNLKKDTIIGSNLNIGTDLNNRVLGQEELKIRIDSLVNLTQGKNANFAKNFFCIPGQLMKVSANISAKVYGPYKKIPYKLEVDDNGPEPELYKFYTNAEMRDLIETYKKGSLYYLNEKEKK